MRIEVQLNRWIIMRGTGRHQSFFAFFVDDDSSSWTKKGWNCHKLRTRREAQEALDNLRRRIALKRKRRMDREEGKT